MVDILLNRGLRQTTRIALNKADYVTEERDYPNRGL